MACHPRLRLGRQTIFPDPTEYLESNCITCHPCDQSLFVYYRPMNSEVFCVIRENKKFCLKNREVNLNSQDLNKIPVYENNA